TLEEIEEKGVRLITAGNGEDALEIIKKESPQLVFLDVMMPKMNGFDLCRVVKNDLKMENVYIVMLTAKGQEVDRRRGREVGADLYITKPFNPDEIIRIAREVLGIE
ncbi:MAG: response regulator, partial [Pelotomaculum sp.]|nr:response regulator [Pelotomaculum sp.]